jgi:hypothetical protein
MRPSLPYLGSQFKLTEQVIALGTVTFTPVLTMNPNRYAVLFCSVNGGQINLARNPNGPLTGSLTLANAANASSQYILLTWDEVASLVQDDWFAIGNIAGQAIGVNEVQYIPTGSVPE